MTDDRRKNPRTLLVADHLWEAFSLMAVEMGSDREALVNQALYTFARLNGFLLPGDSKQPQPAAPSSAASVPIESSRPRPLPGPPTMVPSGDERSTPPPAQAAKGSVAVQVDDSLLGDARTSMDLPNLAASLGGIKQPEKSAPPSAPPEAAAAAGDRTLVLLAEGRELDRVVKDRFLIGRGKHCDLIINSGKVSREHAAISREGPLYFIEDLGSSNGTWFDKRRISRRQIAEGDEYFICSEKLSCAFR
jgi:FHA domain